MWIMYSELYIASVKPDTGFSLYLSVMVPLPQALIWENPTSVQDTEHVLRSFLQSNKLLNTCKYGPFHPVHRVWCAYVSQDATPSSLYSPISAACHCRWQVKVVWNHDTVWKAGNGQPFYLIKSCLMVTNVCGIHTDFMWHNYDCWEKEWFWCQWFACSC